MMIDIEIKKRDDLEAYPTSTLNGSIRQICIYDNEGRVVAEIGKRWDGDGEIKLNYHDCDFELGIRNGKPFIRFVNKGGE